MSKSNQIGFLILGILVVVIFTVGLAMIKGSQNQFEQLAESKARTEETLKKHIAMLTFDNEVLHSLSTKINDTVTEDSKAGDLEVLNLAVKIHELSAEAMEKIAAQSF